MNIFLKEIIFLSFKILSKYYLNVDNVAVQHQLVRLTITKET
jgi:hypothetical protein